MTDSTQGKAPSYDELLATLHGSHDRLVAALDPLGPDQVTAQSYDDDWSIAQVASHLGSGAEIFGLFVDAGRTGEPVPGIESIQPIWDTWNAKSATDQAKDALRSDARLLSQLDGLTEDDHARWHLEIFGGEQSPADLLRLRLSEHAVHTWDIAVALDPAATVAEDATGVIIDQLPWMVERAGKGTEQPTTVSVATSGPERSLVLSLTAEGAELTVPPADDAGTAATIRLPAEAFVRLVYGRLDPDHTPETVHAEGVELDTLRRSFPGV